MKGYHLLLIFTVLFIASCKKKVDDIIVPPPPPPPPPAVITDNDPILFGNHTNAQTSTSFPENYLKDNAFYKIAYSQSRGIPVWVAWHLESGDQGSTPRQDDFRPDPALPIGWYQVQSFSYSGSGFDRGHNCPSADRTSTVSANSSTFLMTNIIPQSPTLNQGPWAALEDYTRNTLVGTSKEAFIVMGNFGVGGYGSGNYLVNTLDAGRVTVPANIWKVIIIMSKGNSDLTRIDTSATVLAVNMPNKQSLYSIGGSGNNAWRNYITNINNLEQQANINGVPLNMLQGIPADIKAYLKAKTFF